MIHGIIFDYGGTIDTNGRHWARVIWSEYQRIGVPVSEELFRQAYVHGERTLAQKPLIQSAHDFLCLLRIKMQLQLDWLCRQGHLSLNQKALSNCADTLATGCNAQVEQTLALTRPVLQQLASRLPLVLVSNFYGNLPTVLRTYGLHHLFQAVIESAAVGVRKPSPAIFALGLNALHLPPENVAVVGDSLTKDILPAKSLGCHTIWLRGQGWEDTIPQTIPQADWVIEGVEEITALWALN